VIWERGKGRVGRGHCARCFTPTLCADPGCGCHVPRGITCRAVCCTAGLFVAIPTDTRESDALARELAAWAKPKPGRKAA
jgi:hypothetical protein